MRGKSLSFLRSKSFDVDVFARTVSSFLADSHVVLKSFKNNIQKYIRKSFTKAEKVEKAFKTNKNSHIHGR